jgi:hypothetical protein
LRVLRIVRGILGTALAFAASWAVLGGALAIAIEALWPSASTQQPMPEFYSWAARSGPLVFGVLGGVAGAAYALVLSVVGRRWAFTSLTAKRVMGLGAVGGLTVGSGLFGAAGYYFGIWPVQYSVGVGIAAVLGAGSAAAMLALARRGRERSAIAPLGDARESALMAAAHVEVERMLSERDNLTMRGADGRTDEAADRALNASRRVAPRPR